MTKILRALAVVLALFSVASLRADTPNGHRVNRAIELLAQGQPIYYTGSHEGTEGNFEQGVKDAQTYADYISYDMEHAPFDVKGLADYMKGLAKGGPTKSGHRTPAVIVTLPTVIRNRNARTASAYSTPFTFADKGPDNIAGTADDQNLTFYGIPNSVITNCAGATSATPTCAFPPNQVTQNAAQNGTYKTLEFALNKRTSHNYSASFGTGYTWQHDFPYGFPNTPNGPFDYDFSSYSAKANGTYNAPFGILLEEELRGRHAHDARRESVSLDELRGLERERHLGPGGDQRDLHLSRCVAWVDHRAENDLRVGIDCFGDNVGGFIDLEDTQIFAAGDVQQHALRAIDRDLQQR